MMQPLCNCDPGDETMARTHFTKVALPYDLTEGDLKLDPAAKNHDGTYEELIKWLSESSSSQWRELELERIMTSTVLLRQRGAGTLLECFKTAVIWERG